VIAVTVNRVTTLAVDHDLAPEREDSWLRRSSLSGARSWTSLASC
jgi:hypothetical protein